MAVYGFHFHSRTVCPPDKVLYLNLDIPFNCTANGNPAARGRRPPRRANDTKCVQPRMSGARLLVDTTLRGLVSPQPLNYSWLTLLLDLQLQSLP